MRIYHEYATKSAWHQVEDRRALTVSSSLSRDIKVGPDEVFIDITEYEYAGYSLTEEDLKLLLKEVRQRRKALAKEEADRVIGEGI